MYTVSTQAEAHHAYGSSSAMDPSAWPYLTAPSPVVMQQQPSHDQFADAAAPKIPAPGFASFWQDNGQLQPQPSAQHLPNESAMLPSRGDHAYDHAYADGYPGHSNSTQITTLNPHPPPTIVTPRDWDMFCAIPHSHPDFAADSLSSPWLTSLTSPTASKHPHPRIKIEEDSDSPASMLSDGLFEDFQQLSPHHAAAPGPTADEPLPASAGLERRRRRSVSSSSSSSKRRAVMVSASHATALPQRQQQQPIVDEAAVMFYQPYSLPQTSHHHHHHYDAAAMFAGDAKLPFADETVAKALSKRIAHKISEKTRRNRLTMAIREMEKLMPAWAKQMPSAGLAGKELGDGTEYVGDSGDTSTAAGRGPATASSVISKVDVVEMAVLYVKKLQEEHAESVRRAEAMDQLLRPGRGSRHDDHGDAPEGDSLDRN
ncbi:hypothetical protein P8C59_006777 [Phyllachora maydis]|uniref:BHLH domain-containing protein n=1 Tax=Phyllachora maydis TaxID=1825666 RepID=A0AAD9MEV9_9PEZI|nr:hypothetical protein P8C59_006777 [Phyllachora maydis]